MNVTLCLYIKLLTFIPAGSNKITYSPSAGRVTGSCQRLGGQPSETQTGVSGALGPSPTAPAPTGPTIDKVSLQHPEVDGGFVGGMFQLTRCPAVPEKYAPTFWHG